MVRRISLVLYALGVLGVTAAILLFIFGGTSDDQLGIGSLAMLFGVSLATIAVTAYPAFVRDRRAPDERGAREFENGDRST